jgi:hypothetical protein
LHTSTKLIAVSFVARIAGIIPWAPAKAAVV